MKNLYERTKEAAEIYQPTIKCRAMYARLFLDGIVLIAAAISAIAILVALNGMIFVECLTM
jgi:hypothetical protein